MTPVSSRVGHDPEKGVNGDCLRACIASLLDRDAEAVPHFYETTDSGEVALGAMRKYLAGLGYGAAMIAYSGAAPLDDLMSIMPDIFADAHYLLFGRTESGEPHVVVCQGDRVVHNPSWGGFSSRITQPTEDGQWVVMGIVLL